MTTERYNRARLMILTWKRFQTFTRLAKDASLAERNRRQAEQDGHNPIPSEEDRTPTPTKFRRKRSVKAWPPAPLAATWSVEMAIERNGGDETRKFLLRANLCDPNLDKVNHGHKPAFKHLERLMEEVTS